MSRYLYISIDGRNGVASGSWQAIVAAIGVREANALAELNETRWVPNLAHDFDEDEVRVGDEDETLIGWLFRYADSWAPVPGEDECDHPRDEPPRCPLCPGVPT